MDPITQQTVLACAGTGGGGAGLYVDDVFSTHLYAGTNANQTITNGIDLSGEGGLVWFKSRTNSGSHVLYDTERGVRKSLGSTSSTDAEFNWNGFLGSNSYGLQSFNSNGFTLGINGAGSNLSSQDMVSWTFRKAPGFFDVVTFTGTGSVQNISHSLGSVPGMIIVKSTSGTGAWNVYHRSTGANGVMYLNGTFGNSVDNGVWNNTAPTSSVFTVGADTGVNANGSTYVAYIFAHDDQSFGDDGDEAIIKCGSFSGGSGSASFVNLGFEPQFLITKQYDGSANWEIADIMRGAGAQSGFNEGKRLFANTNDSEQGYNRFSPTPTGFFHHVSGSTNDNFIYIAIRRPHKPPTDGTDVFAAQASRAASDGTASQLHFTSNFPVDLLFHLCRAGNADNVITVDRMRGGKYLSTSSTSAEQSTIWKFDSQDGVYFTSSSSATSDFGANMFRRAPGFFDIVAYEGNSSARNITHGLGVTPELVVIKSRSLGESWTVNSTHFTSQTGNYLQLNSFSALLTVSNIFSTLTSTTFGYGSAAPSEGSINRSGETYIAYLFASLDGISKVGTYSGTGNDIDVDCGFTAGARFVLVKRTDSTGHWYAWDSARGIVSGNEPYIEINKTSAETTGSDFIDPLNSGFTITSEAPSNMNASGGTYLFLAIA